MWLANSTFSIKELKISKISENKFLNTITKAKEPIVIIYANFLFNGISVAQKADNFQLVRELLEAQQQTVELIN